MAEKALISLPRWDCQSCELEQDGVKSPSGVIPAFQVPWGASVASSPPQRPRLLLAKTGGRPEVGRAAVQSTVLGGPP